MVDKVNYMHNFSQFNWYQVSVQLLAAKSACLVEKEYSYNSDLENIL